MHVKNKLDSDFWILTKRVNYSPFHLVYSTEQAIEKILILPEKIGIREKRAGGGKVIRQMTRDQAIDFVKSEEMVQFPCAVYHDLATNDGSLIYQGEIILSEDYELARINRTPGITNREAMSRSDCINFNSKSWDSRKNLWSNKELRPIVDYCCKYTLIGCVVEFGFYKVPVGVNREKILIWELRNY